MLYGFGFAPAGRAVERDDGYDLSGRWPVVSGCQRASWFTLNTLILDGEAPLLVDGAPVARFMIIPASDVTVERTWDDIAACGEAAATPSA